MEGLGKLKKSTSLGLEPTTFRLMTLCLNQLRYSEDEKCSPNWRIESTVFYLSIST
jgi:hypothetical protein